MISKLMINLIIQLHSITAALKDRKWSCFLSTGASVVSPAHPLKQVNPEATLFTEGREKRINQISLKHAVIKCNLIYE